MPIQLTRPKSVGDLDDGAPGGTYSQVKIIQLSIVPDEKRLNVLVAYGNTVDGKWRQGWIIRPMDISLKDVEAHPDHSNLEGPMVPATTDYTDLVSVSPENTSDSLYAQVKKAIYEALITKGYFSGTVV